MRKILLLLLLVSSVALARPFVPVQDNADLLQPDTIARLEKINDELMRATGKNLLVVTQNGVTGTPREKARDIFRAEGLNGVLLLILPDKKQLGVVPGKSTERLFPPERLGEIRESMLGHIRDGNFDSAVLQGAEATRTTLVAAERPTEAAPAERRSSGGWGLLGWLPLLFLGLVAYTAFRWFTRKPFYGPQNQSGHSGNPAFPTGQQPAYGHPMGGGGFGGGGLFGSLAAGVGGALLGNAVYDAVTGRHAATPPAAADSPSWTDSDAGALGGGDFGGWGGDAGGMGGGDFGGSGSDW